MGSTEIEGACLVGSLSGYLTRFLYAHWEGHLNILGQSTLLERREEFAREPQRKREKEICRFGEGNVRWQKSPSPFPKRLR